MQNIGTIDENETVILLMVFLRHWMKNVPRGPDLRGDVDRRPIDAGVSAPCCPLLRPYRLEIRNETKQVQLQLGYIYIGFEASKSCKKIMIS